MCRELATASVLALVLGAGDRLAVAGVVGQVTQLVLVDACADSDIRVLSDLDEIDLLVDGTCLNIRADTSGTIGSVRFGVNGDGSYQTENNPPYALEGDDGGDYHEWTPALGALTVTATPYSGSNAGGEAGAPFALDLDVVAGSIDFPPPVGGTGSVSGEQRQWHRVTIDFAGPAVDESDGLNPFRTYRMDVQLYHAASDTTMWIPGFFAADGNAAETSATGGAVWRARFAPPLTGWWQYTASFRGGVDAAITDDPAASDPTAFDGATGTFWVSPSNKAAPDHRHHGLLAYVGERYLRFVGSGRWFLKGGADSPENLLGYADFDDTVDQGGSANDLPDGLHRYAPHVGDWLPGDPTWQGGKGKGLIGALNYLASEEMNSPPSRVMGP